MKKFLSFLLIIAGLMTSASATNVLGDEFPNFNTVSLSRIETCSVNELAILSETVKEDLEIAKMYAYLDISNASPSAREIVLAARENIINDNSWYDKDLCSGAMLTDADGNVVKELPAFQDIFPADWDIPHTQIDKVSDMASVQENVDAPRNPGFVHTQTYVVRIPYANESENYYADAICYGTSERGIGQTALALPEEIPTVNFSTICFYDNTVAHITRVPEGYIFWTAGIKGLGYGCRVSTYEENFLALGGTFQVIAPELPS